MYIYNIYRSFVRLGDWDTSLDIDCVGDICADRPVDIPVFRTFTRYESLDDRPTVDNIGIMRLARSVRYTKWISPICLPQADYLYKNHNYVGANFVISGWNHLTCRIYSFYN